MQKLVSVARRLSALGAAAALASIAAPSARAADIAEPMPPAEVVERVETGWRFISPFDPCDMNCTVTVYGGKYIKTPMTDIFIKFQEPPWDWKTKDSGLIAGAFNREILTFGDRAAFETELGVGKRFGGQDEWELWGAIYARWKKFPWHDYLRTTVAVSTGLNYATGISRYEDEKSTHNSKVLHFLSPEITFGLPSQPNLDLIFRFHHRSGGELGIFNKTGGGSQYQTVGLRYRW